MSHVPRRPTRAGGCRASQGMVARLRWRSGRRATHAPCDSTASVTGSEGVSRTGGPIAADLELPGEGASNDLVATAKRHLGWSPRQSGPGPNGGRSEHWRAFLEYSAALGAVAKVRVLFLCEMFSPEAVRASVFALGGFPQAQRVPPAIACGSVLHRLAAQAACDVSQGDIKVKAACGPREYAAGKPGGCEVMHNCISALAEASPQGVVSRSIAATPSHACPGNAS